MQLTINLLLYFFKSLRKRMVVHSGQLVKSEASANQCCTHKYVEIMQKKNFISPYVVVGVFLQPFNHPDHAFSDSKKLPDIKFLVGGSFEWHSTLMKRRFVFHGTCFFLIHFLVFLSHYLSVR